MSAFAAMMGGAECSTSANPLSQLAKASHQDHSLHYAGAHSANAGPAQASMRSMTPQHHANAPDDAQRFFDRGEQHHPLGMDPLRAEIDAMGRTALKSDRLHPEQREWASQYHPAGANLLPADLARLEDQFRMPDPHDGRPSDFAQEFHLHRQQQQQRGSPAPSMSMAGGSSSAAYSAHAIAARPAGFAPSYGAFAGGGGGMGGMSSYMPMHTAPVPPPQQQADTKGKGRFVELDDADWEAQFAQVASSSGATTTTAAEPHQASAAQEQEDSTANLLEHGELDLEATESDAQLLKDLESTWKAMRTQLDANASTSDAELAQWEAQFGSQFNDLHGSPLLDADEADNLFDNLPASVRAQWNKDNVDSFLQDQTPFPFNEENDYLEHADPYAEGMRLLQDGAPLSEAALAFEAACRKDESRAEAWKAAGETWAADEREVKGIRALEKAVACGGPAGVAAWLVSPFPSFS